MKITEAQYHEQIAPTVKRLFVKASKYGLPEIRSKAETIGLLLQDAAGVANFSSWHETADIPRLLDELKEMIRAADAGNLGLADLKPIEDLVET